MAVKYKGKYGQGSLNWCFSIQFQSIMPESKPVLYTCQPRFFLFSNGDNHLTDCFALLEEVDGLVHLFERENLAHMLGL